MSTLNYGRNSKPFFNESDGLFITKPFDVANYLKGFLISKVGKHRQELPKTNSEQSYSCIKKLIMKEKHCKFEFCQVSVGDVENYCY